jgi:hypothetical protein
VRMLGHAQSATDDLATQVGKAETCVGSDVQMQLLTTLAHA